MSIQFADFPSKKMMGASSSSTVEKRKADLVRFFEGLLFFEEVINSEIFKQFIQFEDNLSLKASH